MRISLIRSPARRLGRTERRATASTYFYECAAGGGLPALATSAPLTRPAQRGQLTGRDAGEHPPDRKAQTREHLTLDDAACLRITSTLTAPAPQSGQHRRASRES